MAQTIDPEKIPEAMWKQMNISKEEFKKILAAKDEREKHVPAIGSLAPDFELELLSEKGQRTGQTRRLSQLRGRPVALAFGSYT